MSVSHWGDRDGTPALLLHCTLAQGGAWSGVARHLPDTLSLIAPDLVGHGEGPTPDRTLDFHTQATEAAATHLPRSPAHVIGHSFGATLALRLAIERPDAVRSLTLIEPVLFCATDGPGRARHDALMVGIGPALALGDATEAARIFLSQWGVYAFDDLPERTQAYMRDRIWVPPATEPALIRDNANMVPRLGTVSQPTLLIEGAKSPSVVAEINDRLAQYMPDVRRHTIDGAGHMAPLTHPQDIARLISGFILP